MLGEGGRICVVRENICVGRGKEELCRERGMGCVLGEERRICAGRGRETCVKRGRICVGIVRGMLCRAGERDVPVDIEREKLSVVSH